MHASEKFCGERFGTAIKDYYALFLLLGQAAILIWVIISVFCSVLLLSLKELQDSANKPATLPLQHFFPFKKLYLVLASAAHTLTKVVFIFNFMYF